MMRNEDLLKYVQNIELNLERAAKKIAKLKLSAVKTKALKNSVHGRQKNLENIKQLIAKLN